MGYRFSGRIHEIPRVYHGGRLQGRIKDLIDFSVSINPYELPEKVLKAIETSDPISYPDSEAEGLVSAICSQYGYCFSSVRVTNGISQAISLITQCFIEPGDDVIILGPTYGEYAAASSLFGAHVIEILSEDENSFTYDMDRILDRIRTQSKAKLVWICNPNNPTGVLLPREDLSTIAEACSEVGAILVVDDAYRNFTDHPEDLEFIHPQAIIMRSMTKDFTLAGLRLGYLIAEREIIAKISCLQPEWSINSIALRAGEAVFTASEEYRHQWRATREETLLLASRLRDMGLRVIPPMANTILVDTGSRVHKENLQRKLHTQSMTVRDCVSFGLPGYIRIGCRLPEENDRLIKAIEEIRGNTWED